VLHRLHSLLHTPGGLHGLRLAVEVHVAGDLSFPYTLYYTLPDLLLIREMLRGAGCRCNLVSLVRMPLMQELSWHSHFVNVKAPLCFWQNAPDCSTRMALGLTCHDAPRVPALDQKHFHAVDGMWKLFDVVGVTEMFDEFILLLADMVGLPRPAYRAQLVDSISATASIVRQRRWAPQQCAKLVDRPPQALLLLVERKLNASRNQANKWSRQMECWTYGCVIPGSHVNPNVRRMTPYNRAACEAVTAMQVLQRLCQRVPVDERVYLRARARFRHLLTARLTPTQVLPCTPQPQA
jgi:hypothetical protein